MSSRPVVFTLVGLLVLVGCTAKVVVVKVPSSVPAPAEGVIYALPNTVVRAHLKLDKTEYTAARYASYASIFAPEGKPVCKKPNCDDERTNPFSVQDGATFSTYGEPDPDNVFLVKFVGKGAIDQTVSMTWNEAGLVSAASSSVTNRTGDVVLSTLKLMAGLGTKAALGASKVDVNGVPQPPCQPDGSDADGFVIPILVQQGGTATLQLVANYCEIKKADRDALSRDTNLLTDATRDYVNRLLPLSTARAKILAGTSQSMEPVELLTKIDAEIEHQLTLLYLGTKKTATWDGALDVRSLNVSSATTLLKVNRAKGFCIGSAEIPPETKSIPSEFLSVGNDCDQGTPVSLILGYYPSRDRQLFTKLTDITDGDRSFRYRIPAQVQASLADGTKVYGAGVFSVAQLGTVISLPANRHSKMLSYDLGFIEATGGLKTFKLGTTGALDTATIDALNGVGGTLIDARNTARKNADELTTLTKEDQLLKLRDDICTIQKKYGLPCTVAP
jgi:hypothetical protein